MAGVVVLALAAPQQYHVKKTPLMVKREAKRAVCVYKYKACELSRSELWKIKDLKLSGCAVVSKGVLVVEGPKTAVNKFHKFVMKTRKRDEINGFWQGLVPKSSFVNFSVLHYGSDSALRKFFAAHGASRYWDLAVN